VENNKEKKSVADIIGEVVEDMNDLEVKDESLSKWYNTNPDGNRLRYYGD